VDGFTWYTVKLWRAAGAADAMAHSSSVKVRIVQSSAIASSKFA